MISRKYTTENFSLILYNRDVSAVWFLEKYVKGFIVFCIMRELLLDT